MERASPGWFVGVDAWLDRVYQRIRWRIVPLFVLFGWAAGLVLGVLGVFVFARVQELRLVDVVDLLGLIGAIWLVTAGIALAGSLRYLRPVRTWDRGEQASFDAAWNAVLAAPAMLTRWCYIVALALSAPATVLAFSRESFDGQLLLLVAASAVVGVVLAGAAGEPGLRIVTRPLLRDLAGRMESPPTLQYQPRVRRTLLLVGPMMMIVGGGGGLLLGASPGADSESLLIGTAIAVTGGALIGFPIWLQIAFAMLQPLDDLLAATGRVERGDYSTPVPELSADEHGVLARSLNNAMTGLQERQQLADRNERLVDELRASRSRIVAASDGERRRVERNIHDGAQQRLIALSLDLRMLQEATATAPREELSALVDDVTRSLGEGIEQLRELAAGLHPPVLESEGLPAALLQLAERSPVPVEIAGCEERFDRDVEATAYFVVAEALTNIAKYAHATHALVSVQREGRWLQIFVKDDGVGGAQMDGGTGLSGLVDRVSALNGTLDVSSPRGGGTTVCARISLSDETQQDRATATASEPGR